ncbi:MAG: hypothetical protein WC947_00375 [Elusimicrobiota bacterium]
MDLGSVGFEIEEIEKCFTQIKELGLKRLLGNYKISADQLLESLSLPILLMIEGQKKANYFQYYIRGMIATKNILKRNTKKGEAEIDKYIKARFKEERKNHLDDAKKEIFLNFILR